MKRRTAVFALLAVLGLIAAAWSGLKGRALSTDPQQDGDGRPPRPQAQAPPSAAPAGPTRDLFRFGDEQAPPAAGTPAPQAASATQSTPLPLAAPVAGVRLLGFMRTPAGPKAALALDSGVEVLGPDEQGQGYRVLSIDEDAGSVRLRKPTGEEIDVIVAPR